MDLSRVDHLLDRYFDEALASDERAELEMLLLSSPEARRLFWQRTRFHADLRRLGEETWGRHVAVDVSSRRRALPWRGAAWAGALTAGLLLALVLWLRPVTVGPSQGTVGEPTDDTVAVLLQAPGAVWGESTLPTRVGAPLRPGRLELRAGFAHLEFYNGATVILEGPADLRLISRSEAYCARGKLRATVPPEAHGFTIRSPTLDLVDRGTEFGLYVGAPDQTEVQVFQGQVDLFAPGADLSGPPRQALTTGQGRRLDGPDGGVPVALTPAAFQTAKAITDHAREEAGRREQDWSAASADLSQDPSLVFYYTFRADQPWSRTLPDQAIGNRSRRDGVIVGCTWSVGRWPGKSGLEFKRLGDRVRLHVPGEYQSVTLAAWVRVDALANAFNSLLMADGWEPGEFHWQISSTGAVCLGVQDQTRKFRGRTYWSPEVFTPDRLGQWAHLAVVYDGAGGRVAQYLDGRSIMDVPVRFTVSLRLGDAAIGNWNSAADQNPQKIRNFIGCMDEFMLFTRALTGPEVERLYTRTRPADAADR